MFCYIISNLIANLIVFLIFIITTCIHFTLISLPFMAVLIALNYIFGEVNSIITVALFLMPAIITLIVVVTRYFEHLNERKAQQYRRDSFFR